MNKLNQIAYKCMAREALYLSKAYGEPPERLTNPSVIADDFTLPEEVTGEQMMQQAMTLIRQMAAVHPELKDQMDTLFADEKFLKCGQDYDQLLKLENAAQEEFLQSLRDLREEVDNLRDQYREAGGILYESRINPSAFLDREATEDMVGGGLWSGQPDPGHGGQFLRCLR